MTKTLLLSGVACLSFLSVVHSAPAFACGGDAEACEYGKSLVVSSGASSHAPIGVMGDHMHGEGEWMLSYRFQHMSMSGNRDGRKDLSPEQIVTSVANRFSGIAGQPSTLRVVPTDMSMNMHMFGAMYAPTDWLTLMGMGMWMEKDMELVTFQGGAGTNRLGTFKTQSEGWGDTSLSGLVKLYDDETNHVHLNLGVSLPTGSIKEEGSVLTPMNTTMRMRLPYSMQLGTGTYDLHPGITYTGHQDAYSWGAQYAGEIRLEDENSQGYAYGNKHSVSAWGAYEWAPWISTSLRLEGTTQGDIDGIDAKIVAPVQTADPDNYGGKTVEAAFGVNLLSTSGVLKGNRLAFEAAAPIYEDLNGPQMKRDYTFMLGWQKAF